MELRKYRWSKDYESAEEELQRLFETRKIDPRRWEAESGEDIDPTTTKADTRLWCAEGSFMISVGSKQFSMQPGDTLDIPTGSSYNAKAGIAGCVVYQQG